MERIVADSETLGGALEDVQAFCAVVELGTISAAARQTGETKGSVSRRISRLEKRLGATLLSRTPRAVSPTEEGSNFYVKARDALALLQDATEAARNSRSVPSGHLRVTAPHDFGQEVLPTLLVEFHRAHPQVSIELILTDTTLDLATHRIDLALRATQGILPDTDYRASSLGSFQIKLYAAASYLKEHPAPDTPEALADHDVVHMGDYAAGAANFKLQNRQGASKEVRCRALLTASDYASVHSLIRAGGGIGALPDIVAAASVAQGQLLAVLPEWTLAHAELHALSVSGREAPARVRVLRDFMREQLARIAADKGADS